MLAREQEGTMTDETDRRKRGLQVLAEMLGEDFAKATEQRINSGGFGSALAGVAADLSFADVWGRDGLDRGARSLVVIGVLIALESKSELKHHFHIGMNHGLTPQELEEVVLQALPYAGVSKAGPALGVLREVLAEAKSGGH